MLRQADVRALLQQRLRGRPTRSNFRTGTLTVCTMVPMRSVPHRVVCLVGLDDGVFPRATGVDGDDVLARSPRTGERDVRSEDRQLLLDAIAATTETLVITYTGRGEHNGAERPPAVPLGELLDALDRTAAAPVRDARAHPAPAAALRRGQPRARAPARRSDPSPSTGPRWPAPWPRAASERSCASWCRVRCRPSSRPPRRSRWPTCRTSSGTRCRGSCGDRLRITKPYDADEIKDAIPITLDALEQWAVGDRIVNSVMAGADPQAAMLAEQLRGVSCRPASSVSGCSTHISQGREAARARPPEACRAGPSGRSTSTSTWAIGGSPAPSATSSATASSRSPSPTSARSTGWPPGSTPWPSPRDGPTRTGPPTRSASTAPAARSR